MNPAEVVLCEQYVSATEKCPSAAWWLIYWPGRKPIRSCTVHKDKALAIAEAMGFELHVEAWP